MANQMYQSIKVDPKSGARIVDLRSDTLTQPTKEMRQAMAEAVVGDDVLGEDPTVNSLEERVAKLLGKESGLFVPSGTMSNLLSVMTHCNERGSEMFIGDKSHIFLYEQGGSSYLAGAHPSVLPNLPDGTFDLDLLVSKVRGDDSHFPKSKLICIENSHNNCGGKALPLSWLEKLQNVSRDQNLPIHIDGARLFNSAFYYDVPITKLTEGASSVSLCLSKGIGAPVGSVLTGSESFIKQARRYRKAVGGGMRQCGILAAAAHVALDGAEQRMRTDHENAKKIVLGINETKSLKITSDPNGLHTNIVLVTLEDNSITAADFADRLSKVSEAEMKTLSDPVVIQCFPIKKSVVRLVLHGDISKEDSELAAEKIKFVIKEFDAKN